MGYSNTMQALANTGVVAIDGYHRGTPQLIPLDVECTGNLVKIWSVPTKEMVLFNGKKHVKLNAMHVCTLKLAGNWHGNKRSLREGCFGFLRTQNISVSSDRVGGGGGGEGCARGERVEERDDLYESDDQ